MSYKQIILLVIVLILGNIPLYKLIFEKETVTYCGVVVDKSRTDVASTHKNTTNVYQHDYLYVKFDNGTYEQMNVTTDTFYKNNVGDRVCFEYNKDGVVDNIMIIISLIFAAIDIMGLFVLLIFISDFIWELLQ